MKKTLDIVLDSTSQTLTVTGNYEPRWAGTRDAEGHLPCFEITQIEWDGKDVTVLLFDLDYEIIIEKIVIEEIENN